jgi:hypothetical protein
LIPSIVQKLPIMSEGRMRPTAEISLHAAQASPPTVVAAGIVARVDMPSVVVILTAVYLLCQIGYLLWKWRREAMARATAAP